MSGPLLNFGTLSLEDPPFPGKTLSELRGDAALVDSSSQPADVQTEVNGMTGNFFQRGPSYRVLCRCS
jgi:hypothetical protein